MYWCLYYQPRAWGEMCRITIQPFHSIAKLNIGYMLTCHYYHAFIRLRSFRVLNTIFRGTGILFWRLFQASPDRHCNLGVVASLAENSISRIASGRETVGLAFMNAMVFWARGSTWTLTIDILGVCRYKIAQHLLGGYDVIINLTHCGGFGRRDFFW